MVKRGLWILCLVFLCFCLGTGGQAAEPTKEIPIIIKERAGIDWKNTPLTVGVPVPAGNGAFATPPRVLDQWGREVPSQAVLLSASSTAVLPQWWRITFFATVNRGDTLVYRVVPGAEKRVLPRVAVTVEKTATGYVVENNSLKMELREDQPLVARAWFDPSGRGSFKDGTLILATPLALGLRTAEGALTIDSAAQTQIKLEESGPVRAVFRISGKMRKPGKEASFTYDGRLIFYADTPYFRLELKLVNTGGSHQMVEEAWVGANFNLKGERIQAAFGSEGKTPKTGALRPNEQAQLLVDAAGRIRWGGIFSGINPAPAGTEEALGWVDLTGTDWGVGLGVKAFRPQYPKGLQVGGTGEMKVQLLPSSSPLLWGAGVAKTHDLTLYFHSARDRESLNYLKALTNQPPVAMPDANWLNQTGVFGQPFLTDAFLAALDPQLRSTAALLKEKYHTDLLNLYGPSVGVQEINPEHWGFFHYGDLPVAFTAPWAVTGKYWNNNAYDLPYQLLWAYLQSGDPALLTIGEAALTHWQDVDLVNPEAIPRPSPGLEHLKDPRQGVVSMTEDFRHFANGGLLLGYYLLDDQYGYELALRMADRVTLQDGVNQDDPRTFAAGLMTVVAAYQASGRERYLDRAAELVDLVLAWQEGQGGGFPSDFIYKAGLLTDSLVAYYRITGDPRVLKGIQKAVDYALYHYWDERSGLIQSTGGILFSSALDLLYRETGENKYYNIGKTQVNAFVNKGAVTEAKDVALFYRNVFSFFNGALRQDKGK